MANPSVAVAISKQVGWHGKQEEYSNVYYFDGPAAVGLGSAQIRGLVDALVAAEKPVHAGVVEFMTGRVWSVGGTPAENVTIGLFDLDGFGGGGYTAEIFREAAVNVEWECDRLNIDGRKVYLRKYIRPGGGLNLMSASSMLGEGMLEATVKAKFKTYANAVQTVSAATGLDPFKLVSPKGRLPRSDANGVVNDYLISREFRRN